MASAQDALCRFTRLENDFTHQHHYTAKGFLGNRQDGKSIRRGAQDGRMSPCKWSHYAMSMHWASRAKGRTKMPAGSRLDGTTEAHPQARLMDPEQLETTENILREPSTVSQPGQFIERLAQQEHFTSITTSPAITGCIMGADLDKDTNGSESESLSVVSSIPIDTAAPTMGEDDKRPFTKPAAAVFVRQQLPLEAVQEEQPPAQREPYSSTLQSCTSCAADSVLDPPEQQRLRRGAA
uniref:Uncharacterized protein n=1 Tax=Anopheles atroparvus TaxID=41427 RepID=A0A182J044_ANOAO